jgi:hypothetical protein
MDQAASLVKNGELQLQNSNKTKNPSGPYTKGFVKMKLLALNIYLFEVTADFREVQE